MLSLRGVLALIGAVCGSAVVVVADPLDLDYPPPKVGTALAKAADPATRAKAEAMLNDPAYRAAHRNAWARMVLTISPDEIASESTLLSDFRVSDAGSHPHHGGHFSVAVAGMEAGHRVAENLRYRLQRVSLEERARWVDELVALQQSLRAEERAPLPYCPQHRYASKADRKEAQRAAREGR